MYVIECGGMYEKNNDIDHNPIWTCDIRDAFYYKRYDQAMGWVAFYNKIGFSCSIVEI